MMMAEYAMAAAYMDRIDTLQRMLDLGASRGLQIIILTCNPSDYAALGARQVILKSDIPPQVFSPGRRATA